MFRQDYILRMAEEIGTAISALIVRATKGDSLQATQECRELCRQQVGLDLDFIVRLAPPNLLQLLQQGGQGWSGKAAGLVEILQGHGRLAESAGDRQTALPCYVHAFYLLRELAPFINADEAALHRERLNQITQKLEEFGLGGLVHGTPATAPSSP